MFFLISFLTMYVCMEYLYIANKLRIMSAEEAKQVAVEEEELEELVNYESDAEEAENTEEKETKT